MTKQKVIIYGVKNIKLYRFYYPNRWMGVYTIDPEIHSYSEKLEEVIAWEGEIDNPPLEIGEKLYISDFDKTVLIEDKARNSDGGYIYWTEYEVELTENDTTLETKKCAESEKEKYEAYSKQRKESESEDQEIEYEKKKWYQFWK